MTKIYSFSGTVNDGYDISFTTEQSDKKETVLHLSSPDEAAAIAFALNFLSENEECANLIISIAKKSQKWDFLDADIAKFYPDGDGDKDVEGDLASIGEIAAIRLGYL